tara:strand:+ start:252 stop:488 length:237 start_codon:yes stop_codon:yes gene_type:complete
MAPEQPDPDAIIVLDGMLQLPSATADAQPPVRLLRAGMARLLAPLRRAWTHRRGESARSPGPAAPPPHRHGRQRPQPR